MLPLPKYLARQSDFKHNDLLIDMLHKDEGNGIKNKGEGLKWMCADTQILNSPKSNKLLLKQINPEY